MAAVAIFAVSAAVFVKTLSYGIWEMRRENKAGGIFSITLAVFCFALAVRYLINYRA